MRFKKIKKGGGGEENEMNKEKQYESKANTILLKNKLHVINFFTFYPSIIKINIFLVLELSIAIYSITCRLH